MVFRVHFCIAIILLLSTQPLFAQKEVYSPYYLIKRKYENRSESDSAALPMVRVYIKMAKDEKNHSRLVEGYQDVIYYSLDDNKIKYADSALYSAQLSRDEKLIGRAHLSRGSVFYFTFKKYKLALEEFLKAYEYAKKGDDKYYINKVAYRLALVKSYIGYYDDALLLFRQTKDFFKQESEKKMHINLQYGNKRGYYNSLHQMSVCYRHMGKQKAADSIAEMGLALTAADKDYEQEFGYFLKEKGISEFSGRKYSNSINTLKSAKTVFQVLKILHG